MVTVISLGGSIVAPDKADERFLRDFTHLVETALAEDSARRFIFVVGGGGPARAWQEAYRGVARSPSADEADWIGVMATRLNAQLVRGILREWCPQAVVTDPTQVSAFEGRVLVAAGWKPGFSSDYDAVLLAERFHADTVINLSNISQVYTEDPKVNPQATPIDRISWPDFQALVGSEWIPGKNVPFDPVASRYGANLGLRVICAAGRDLANLKKILQGDSFLGTVIGPR
ncbi:MAG: UMP kinase [Spirochaetaceae bacterium]|jgi:uridylate kinase|nr:UMP kinase [Spirochaetaceae bacterium]